MGVDAPIEAGAASRGDRQKCRGPAAERTARAPAPEGADSDPADRWQITLSVKLSIASGITAAYGVPVAMSRPRRTRLMAWRPSGGPDHTAPDTLATGEAPSIGHVRALSLAGATGLLICEAPGVRIDTFLLGGRIAWAMRHGHRSSFAAHLHVAPQTLRALVTECPRTGHSPRDAPLGR